MLEHNLTQRERQILVRLLELSQHSNEQFEARPVDPAARGPSHEFARLDFGFGGDGQSMEIAERDLRLPKDEGLIHFRWHPSRSRHRTAHYSGVRGGQQQVSGSRAYRCGGSSDGRGQPRAHRRRKGDRIALREDHRRTGESRGSIDRRRRRPGRAVQGRPTPCSPDFESGRDRVCYKP